MDLLQSQSGPRDEEEGRQIGRIKIFPVQEPHGFSERKHDMP